MNLFAYDTYQDVRKNLFFYSIPSLIGAGLFCWWRIIPPEHQRVISSWLSYLSHDDFWNGVAGTGAGIILFSLVAYLLTEILQVHDQWWDKYIKKWRYYYAVDYILPRLVQPFGCHLNYRFREEAEKHVRTFQEALYYPFVGDRDLKIPKNKLVRFYEVITLYWLTQINEFVICVLGLVVVFYAFKGPADKEYWSLLLSDSGVLAVAFIVNRLFARGALGKVRRETEEEIRAIHEDKKLRDELKSRLRELCSNYHIPYIDSPP